VKFPLLVFEIWCAKAFLDADSQTHGQTHPKTEYLQHLVQRLANYSQQASSGCQHILTVPQQLPELVQETTPGWILCCLGIFHTRYFKNLDINMIHNYCRSSFSSPARYWYCKYVSFDGMVECLKIMQTGWPDVKAHSRVMSGKLALGLHTKSLPTSLYTVAILTIQTASWLINRCRQLNKI